MALAAVLLKPAYKGLSDEDITQVIAENPYLQYFIGLRQYTAAEPFNACQMTRFRQRITPEMMSEINDMIIGRPKPEEKKEPVKEEKPKPKEERKVEPELPKIPENKPKVRTEQNKSSEPYTTSAIISPMFGKKEKEAKPVKKKRREIVMPDSELGEKKSILGTVFSPLYGDKNESDNVPRDEVDPSVANLSVKDFLNEAKPEKKAEQPKAEEKVLPIREEVKKEK